MGINPINRNMPSSISTSGTRASFVNRRWLGQRYEFDPAKQIVHPGTHGTQNLHFLNTTKPAEFFAEKGLPKSNWVVGLYNGDIGSLANPVKWVSVSRTASFVADHVHNMSLVKQLLDCCPENIAKTEISGRDIVMTHVTDKLYIPLNKEGRKLSPAMGAMVNTLDSLDLGTIDHVTLENGSNTMRIHFNITGMSPVDMDVTHLKLGKKNLFNDPAYPDFHVRIVCPDYIEAVDVLERRRDTEAPVMFPETGDAAKTGADITAFRPRYFIEYHTCRQSRFNSVIPAECAGQYEHAGAIRVRAGVKVRHLNAANGRETGTEEILPFLHKLPHFPNMEYYNPDPDKPFGSEFTEGATETVLFPQHLVESIPDKERQSNPVTGHDHLRTSVPTTDQRFFFAEKMNATGAYPEGTMFKDKSEQPWWFRALYGTHGLFRTKAQAGKASHFLTGKEVREGSGKTMGSGMSAGPHTVTANPVLHNMLYNEEKVGRRGLWKTSIPEILTIIEDALGSYSSYLWQGARTVPMNYIAAFGSAIENMATYPGQRSRWNGGLAIWLSSLSKIAGKDLVQGSLNMIPKAFKAGQVWEWANVGTWYYDATLKLGAPMIAASFALFGVTPLTVAGAISLPALFISLSFSAWPSYANQAAKMRVNPKRTMSLKPLEIFWWMTAAPEVHRSNMNIEDVSNGPFRSFDGSYGNRISPQSKRAMFWLGTVTPLAAGTTLGGYLSYVLMGAGVPLAAALAPMGIGILASNLITRGLNSIRALDNPGGVSPWPSLLKATGYAAPLVGGLAVSIGTIAASTSVLSVPVGSLLAIGFWSMFNGLNMVNVWAKYFREQSIMQASNVVRNADTLRNAAREIFDIRAYFRD